VLFFNIAVAVHDIEQCQHPDPLAQFCDMLKEEYPWSEEYDEKADEIRYEEDEVFTPDLFYSFYYYFKLPILC